MPTKMWIVMVLSTSFLLFFITPAEASSWPMYGQNPYHTGFYPIKGTSNLSGYYAIEIDLPGDSYVYPQPIVANIVGDSDKEIIISSDPGHLNAVSSKGELIWTIQFSDVISTSPTISDVNEDGKVEIIFGSWNGLLYSLNTKGEINWRFATSSIGIRGNGRINSNAIVDDIDGDGEKEIIFGGDNHCIICLSSDGELKWYYQLEGDETPMSILSTPTICDIDNDGIKEIIIGSDYKYLYVINAFKSENQNVIKSQPSLRWRFEIPSEYLAITATPVVYDLNNDNYLEILIGTRDSFLYCLDVNGNVIWKFQTGREINIPCSVADLDNDGNPEIILGSYDKHIYVLDSRGKLKWEIETNDVVASQIILCDIDNNNKTELICVTPLIENDYSISILSPSGKLLNSFSTKGTQSGSARKGINLCVSDLEDDGTIEIIMGTQDGYLIIFRNNIVFQQDHDTENRWTTSFHRFSSLLIAMAIIVVISIYIAYQQMRGSHGMGDLKNKNHSNKVRKGRYKRIR